MTIRSARKIRAAAALFAISGAALVGTATAANATMSCGESSFGFEGTRLLNDGISNTAGPFAIELPAGTYDVLVQSHDAHDLHPGQVEQTQEQWYFSLDSGYTSPVTSDVADDKNLAIDEFDGQVIASSTAVTLHHLGEGGVNSVDPVCIGFTASPVEIIEPAPATEPEIEIAGPVLPPKEVVELVEVPVVEAVVPEVVIEAPVPVQVKEVVEVKAAVKAVEAPVIEAAQLALTGPSAATTTMLFFGIGLVAIGGALMATDRYRLR